MLLSKQLAALADSMGQQKQVHKKNKMMLLQVYKKCTMKSKASYDAPQMPSVCCRKNNSYICEV